VISLISVPHTGTRFVQYMLRNHGFDVTINHYELNGTPPEGILISPLRDPWLNYVSHISKNRSYQLFNYSKKHG